MDLAQLANLGEFIGGIAVVATLAYLAIQTKHTRFAAEQNARFSGLQASGAVVEQYGRWTALAADPAISDLIAKANGRSTSLTV